MPSWGGPERRRSLAEIVSDLGFLDRRQSENAANKPAVAEGVATDKPAVAEGVAVEKPAIAEGVAADKPAVAQGVAAGKPAIADNVGADKIAVARDTSQPIPDAEDSAAPLAEPTQYDGVIATLRDVRQRAAEQRLAAERALAEARAFESRIAEEEEHILAASELAAKMRPLVQAAEIAAAAERAAQDRLRASEVKLGRIVDERNRAASAQEQLLANEKAGVAEVVRLEAALASARNALLEMTAAVASGSALLETARAQEESARAEAAMADAAMKDVRREREQADVALNALKEREAAMKGKVLSLDLNEELRALETRAAAPGPTSASAAGVPASRPAVEMMSELERRAANRRAADAARRTAS